MKIDIPSHENEHMVLALKGALDRDGSRKLTRFLLSRDCPDYVHLELDLKAVDFVGLSAIAALHELCTSLAKRGGTMTLKRVSREVEAALSSSRKTPCWILRNPDHQ